MKKRKPRIVLSILGLVVVGLLGYFILSGAKGYEFLKGKKLVKTESVPVWVATDLNGKSAEWERRVDTYTFKGDYQATVDLADKELTKRFPQGFSQSGEGFYGFKELPNDFDNITIVKGKQGFGASRMSGIGLGSGNQDDGFVTVETEEIHQPNLLDKFLKWGKGLIGKGAATPAKPATPTTPTPTVVP